MKNQTEKEILSNFIALHFPHKISKKVLEFSADKRIGEIVSCCIGSKNIKMI